MDELVIYSVGDVVFLRNVLSAVAEMTDVDSQNGYGDMLQAAALIGVLVYAILGLMKNQFPQWQQAFMGWVLVMVLIIPRTDVVLESVYNQQPEVVDNVPYGVAMLASFISKIGYGVTEVFETQFQSVNAESSMKKSGFIDPLVQLSNVRKLAEHDTKLYAAINDSAGPGTDIGRSLKEYMVNCLYNDLNHKLVTHDAIVKGDPEITLASKLINMRTTVYSPVTSGGTVEMACPDALKKIMIDLDLGVDDSDFDNSLSSILSVPTDTMNGATVMDRVDTAMRAIDDTGATAQDFVKNTILKGAYERYMQDGKRSAMDAAGAVMMSQAIMQRNTAFTAQGSGWMQTAHMLATFIEALVFAITPIVGILLAFGAGTAQTAMKYFGMLLWVQMWMPVMSVINMFTYLIVQRDLSAMNQTFMGDETLSFAKLEAMSQSLDSWIAVAGWMQALTPVFAMFFAFGSMQVASNLAGRFVGGGLEGHVKPSVATPDALNTGPVATVQSQYSKDATHGTHASGSQGTDIKYNAKTEASQAAASAVEQAKTSQTSFSDGLQQALSQSKDVNNSFGKMGKFSGGLSSTGSKQVQAMDSIANTLGKEFNLSDADKAAFSKSVASNTAAGLGWNLILKLGIDSTSSTEKKAMQERAHSLMQKSGLSETGSLNKSDGAQLANNLSNAIDTTSGRTVGETFAKTNGRTIGQAQQDVFSKSEKASQSKQIADSAGAGQEISAMSAAENIANLSKAGNAQAADFRNSIDRNDPVYQKTFAQYKGKSANADMIAGLESLRQKDQGAFFNTLTSIGGMSLNPTAANVKPETSIAGVEQNVNAGAAQTAANAVMPQVQAQTQRAAQVVSSAATPSGDPNAAGSNADVQDHYAANAKTTEDTGNKNISTINQKGQSVHQPVNMRFNPNNGDNYRRINISQAENQLYNQNWISEIQNAAANRDSQATILTAGIGTARLKPIKESVERFSARKAPENDFAPNGMMYEQKTNGGNPYTPINTGYFKQTP